MSNSVEVEDFSMAFSSLSSNNLSSSIIWSIDKGLESYSLDSRDNFGRASIMEKSYCAGKPWGEKFNSVESEEVCCVGSSGAKVFLEAITMWVIR